MSMGYAAVIAAAVLYGFMPIFTKGVLLTGMSSFLIVFYRMVFAGLISGLILLATRQSLKITKRQFLEMLVFGIGGFGLTGLTLFTSYNYMAVGTATMFHFCYPLFVMVGMIVLFHERWSRWKVLSALAALIGLFLLMDKQADIRVIGVVIAVISGITYGTYVVATKKCEFGKLPGMVIIFYVSMINAVFFMGVNLIRGEFYLPTQGTVWLNLVLIGFLCTVLALGLLTYGIKVLGATKSAVLNMLEPITSILAGMVLFQEVMTMRSALGCLCIILSVLFIAVAPAEIGGNREQIEQREQMDEQEPLDKLAKAAKEELT